MPSLFSTSQLTVKPVAKQKLKNLLILEKIVRVGVVKIYLPPLESQQLQNIPNRVTVKFPYIN